MSYISRLARCLVEKDLSSVINVKLNEDNFIEIFPSVNCPNPPLYNIIYVPELAKFLNDDSVNQKIIIGAYGSGKTSGFVNAILRDAVRMPACDDGVRRSKVALIRNTAGQLERTTLKTWLYWTTGLPIPYRNKKPNLTYRYEFRDKDGLIELDLLFLALESITQIADLDSLELTSAFFNEVGHMPKGLFDRICGRVRRYPPKIQFMELFYETFPETKNMSVMEQKELLEEWCPYTPRIYADTNAPKNNHWIPELEKKESLILKIYHQPPALIKNKEGKYEINSKADNLAWASREYYLEMIDKGEEYIRVYAQGLYGTVVDGKPVYPYYRDDVHSVETLPIMADETIIIGCDYGIVAPAVIITQFIKGQIRFIKEFIGDCVTITDIFKSSVLPFLNMYCKGFPLEVVGDPADTAQGRAQLRELGIDAMSCSTNRIEARISAVTNALNETYQGVPRILISRKGCPCLREGFIADYNYQRLRIIGEEKYRDIPEKTHPYSDIHDAAQYVVIKILGENQIFKYADEPYFRRQTYADKDKSKVTGY